MATESLSPTNLICLECPVCLVIPRKEIYQCINGHSICNTCMKNVEVCPTCRVIVAGSNVVKIRNYYAENFLDAMKFACIWSEHGCDVVIARNHLTEHESNCKFGAYNLCTGFFPSKECHYQFSRQELRNPGKVQDILNHMKSVHKCGIAKQVQWNLSLCLYLNQADFNLVTGSGQSRIFSQPFFQEVVSEPQQSTGSDIFVLIFNIEEDQDKKILFSFAFAMLTSDEEDETYKPKIQVLIRSQKNPDTSDSWGDECIPDLKWTMKAMCVQKLKTFLAMPVKIRPPFPFTLPISHIRKHYVDHNGIFAIRYSFHRN